MKHIHDCTGEDATCVCGYRSPAIPRPRTAEDIIDDIVSCSDDEDGRPVDALNYARELYELGVSDGKRNAKP